MIAALLLQVARRKRWISHGEANGSASDLPLVMQLESSEWKIGTYWKSESKWLFLSQLELRSKIAGVVNP
jgi:hypothetical protein